MKMFSTLLDLCKGKAVVTDGYLDKELVMWGFAILCSAYLNKLLNK